MALDNPFLNFVDGINTVASTAGNPSLDATDVTFDVTSLNDAIVYVTVQTGAPGAFTTPLVFDDTAVTGGLYAWDGSAYQQVGPPL